MSDVDALLVVGFGGPEGPDEVLPFLEHVLAGRDVSRERLLAVAAHYHHFGGVSPIGAQSRALVAAVQALLDTEGPRQRVYLGNRHSAPFVVDALRAMQRDGVTRSLAFVPSAFGSYASCRAYREAIDAARREVGDGAPSVEKLRLFHDHPRFISAHAARLGEALALAAADATLVFTAHSIPLAMAQASPYVAQLEETIRRVGAAVGRLDGTLVWQSRSGPPSQPWLEPDVLDHLRALAARGVRDVVLAPIGFLSDHMEVAWDLDTEAGALADSLGIRLVRAATPGTHPEIVTMVRDLVVEHSTAPCDAMCCRPGREGGKGVG